MQHDLFFSYVYSMTWSIYFSNTKGLKDDSAINTSCLWYGGRKINTYFFLRKSPNLFNYTLIRSSWLSLTYIQENPRQMNINTIFLLLLVIAAYLNLYLTFTKKNKKTKLPISSKEWRERVEDENFKSWISNRKRLKDKRK